MKIEISQESPNTHIEELLWDVLWKPFGFDKKIRQEFKLNTEEIFLIAKIDTKMTGVLVANRISKSEYEVRHIAVQKQYQKTGIGRELFYKFEVDILHEYVRRITAIVRNTSQEFFEKLGFRVVQDYPDHPEFKKHGIKFSLMEKNVRR